MTAPLLEVVGLTKSFHSGGRRVVALDDVSLSLAPGETLGLVGASGYGKSTLARVLVHLIAPEGGSIRFRGQDWLGLNGAPLRAARRHLQMVFQDPLAAFNPRATVGSVLTDPLRIHALAPRAAWREEVARLLTRVGLAPEHAGRSILDLSGGQRQRVAIARALALKPDLIVLDEAVSALDVAVRAHILELLVELQRASGLAYIFISHDLAAVRAVSHRIAVMEAGRIVESGPAARIVRAPESAAARALIAAVPHLVREKQG
ncbi:peptide/nickel transport system ATP-binding protein [Angulomicrobium tetraedrale]|uniref:Glutathione import ATP-binding protein GsiA n=1 Tax=Ancylobacter tetraedralis TaxID=217068 RepID=A0A839ZA98_9HYPH|nr:dipeptide/oligopeptide/nickel ABC transporter ATP-binding protein [Ancylobacter tetraedralis]MBB3771647.1 peptide/nickel transport system ATP-binding protein [Ancylobacter tetraedralis]